MEFVRTSEAEEAHNLQADWEKGQMVRVHRSNNLSIMLIVKIYIIFSVQDTGRGLNDAERELLFARFSQGSPRTHIDYGKLRSSVS